MKHLFHLVLRKTFENLLDGLGALAIVSDREPEGNNTSSHKVRIITELGYLRRSYLVSSLE